jgi:hypothetical protein
MTKMYRQGDLLFKRIKSLPKKAKKRETDIILRGEATGHAHRIENGIIYWIGAEIYIDAGAGTMIVHEEHASLKLEPGYYEVIRQREYDPQFGTSLTIQD